MQRGLLLIIILSICAAASAQYNIPPYTVIKDSATHTTVRHSNDQQIVRIRNAYNETGAFVAISPDIKISNGIVDHKGPTGDLYVREYFYKDKLIGYIQYDWQNKEREIYYNSTGDVTLEKRYDKGAEVYKNDTLRKASAMLIPVNINHGNTTR